MSTSSCGYKVRVICSFIVLSSSDFPKDIGSLEITDGLLPPSVKSSTIYSKISAANDLNLAVKKNMEEKGYEVQTTRIATNSFTEYCDTSDTSDSSDDADDALLTSQITLIDAIISSLSIHFFSLGPCKTILQTSKYPLLILPLSPRLSLSSTIAACDLLHAQASARTIIQLSKVPSTNGLLNFRYCAQSTTSLPHAPFFPSAYSESVRPSTIRIAIGLENGFLANEGLALCSTLDDIGTKFRDLYSERVAPLVEVTSKVVQGFEREGYTFEYVGIDTSLNPSLDKGGSIGSALESLPFVPSGIGGVGVMAAAAAITTTIQSLPFTLTGYCGIMLPVCEDYRLSEIQAGEGRKYTVSHLMNISSVCGVGVDTVPIPKDVRFEEVAGVILDICGLAARWNKPLSVRMFPVPDLGEGEMTGFDSPYLCNTKVFSL
ncbi:hypothetical protein TrST_g7088 [Triparma strigata]|uniref:DUF711 family protein n=1 Tax=Triparma strigata TaxID=1606541 RepID=A0A9W7APH9_9STRA|nr:hypothetical protein TrST_g7088 [Triparma strigata]